MALTILSVASPFIPIDSDSETTEGQVVAALDAALTRLGHRSVVIGIEGAAIAGTLVPLPRPSAQAAANGTGAVHAKLRGAIEAALDRYPVDLIHIHAPDVAGSLPPPGLPALVTLHLPLDRYPAAVFRTDRPETYFHGLSATQTRDLPAGLPLMPPVEPGVAVERLHIRIPKRNFVVALGPVDRFSRFDLALDAAHALDIQFVLSGEVPATAADRQYFLEKIKPRLDPRRRFIGPVGFSRRRWMLGAARCLVSLRDAPVAADLAVLEALACGTPVVGFAADFLAETIEPGLTGYLIDDPAALPAAIEATGTIDPEACRQVARVRYSNEAMAGRYLTLYDELTQGIRASVGMT